MDSDSRSFRCYSVRRLNPFLGVVQIVETTDSRAISPDGVDWEIQILAERPYDTWGMPSPVKQKRQFLRFGVWNSVDGLKRVPANPLLNLTIMFNEANRLIDILLLEAVRIPFLLSDRFELWLLDDHNQLPQALLASTTEFRTISTFNINRWVCYDKEFPSTHMNQQSSRLTGYKNPIRNKSYLETIVKQRASKGIKRWFKRTIDDSGKPLLSDLEQESTSHNERLPAGAFPLLLLNTSWEDPLAGSVISDFHDWIAPYLLTLQNLPDDLRASLEKRAVARAVAVNSCWRLFPKIINKKIIDAARVEARMRQSHKS